MSVKRPPELQVVFDALEQAGPYASIDEVNSVLAGRVRDYNTRPQPDLGGLSPDEMSQLLYGDWESRGALRLNRDLTIDELTGAAILTDARMLLEYFQNHGPVKETAAHNLPRAVVADLLPRLRMHAQRRIAVDLGEPRPINEGDVLWLPILRHTLTLAGLVMRRKGLRTTTLGRALLSPDHAGRLYTLIFRTLFRKLDLRALDRDGRHPGLQATIAYSFYALRTATRDWTSPEELAERAWLESAKDPPTEWEAANIDFRYYALRHRVLDPLVQFGLLEERVLPSEDRWKELVEYRCTSLFDRFVRFEFRPPTAGNAPFLMQ